jgi:hypothetical protein
VEGSSRSRIRFEARARAKQAGKSKSKTSQDVLLESSVFLCSSSVLYVVLACLAWSFGLQASSVRGDEIDDKAATCT